MGVRASAELRNGGVGVRGGGWFGCGGGLTTEQPVPGRRWAPPCDVVVGWLLSLCQ